MAGQNQQMRQSAAQPSTKTAAGCVLPAAAVNLVEVGLAAAVECTRQVAAVKLRQGDAGEVQARQPGAVDPQA